MEVLFINSCVRSKGISRTYTLASHFIRAYEKLNPKHNIIHLDLATEKISPLTHYNIEMQKKQMWNKPHYAQQFIRSDKIIIAAPVWNMGCPSVLHIYIENICLPGITFEYTKDGYKGLCSEKKIIYISTMGGIKTPEGTTGAEYIQAVFARLGVDDFEYICVEGMDINGDDTGKLPEDAIKICELAAESW